MKISIKEWSQRLKDATSDEQLQLMNELAKDTRKGAVKLYESYEKKLKQLEDEQIRLEKMMIYEKQCLSLGKKRIAGVDEVGRGPLAGPVVAAAVILPEGYKLRGINDSKKLSESKREALYKEIISDAIAYEVCLIDPKEIDRINIYQASKTAMTEAVSKLTVHPDQLLIDAMELPLPIDQIKIIKGDEKSISIAAASIVAKVTRDRVMKDFDSKFPEYGFKTNMGYGTKEHLQALKEYGATTIHRRSFNPVGEFILK